MGRLIDWPVGLYPKGMDPLSGPQTVGGGSTTGSTGFVQTFASPFGLWKWQFTMPPMRGRVFRRYRGMVLALHGGANAVKFPFFDPDGITFDEMGIANSRDTIMNGVNWSNDQPWANQQRWTWQQPSISVLSSAAAGDISVKLGTEAWGSYVGIGDYFGFTGIYGLFAVTGVNDDGSVIIWPPLRADVTSANRATLNPTIVFRLESETGANLTRGLEVCENAAITFIEVEHQDVIDFFGG